MDLACLWSGRAHAAAAAGAPVSWSWDQGLWTYEGFVILKGTPNADLCREFIEFCADARRQAACASMPYQKGSSPGNRRCRPDRHMIEPFEHRGDRRDEEFFGAVLHYAAEARLSTYLSRYCLKPAAVLASCVYSARCAVSAR